PALRRTLPSLGAGAEVGSHALPVDAGFLPFGEFAGHDRSLLEIASRFHRIARELFHTKRNALLLDVDVKDLGFDHVALLVFLDHLLARTLPVEIGQVDHAVHITIDAEERAEFGLVFDFALPRGARRMLLDEHFPRIAHGLLETERNPALHRIDFENLHFNLLRGRNDLARMNVLLRPGHFRHVDQALDPWLEFNEGSVVADVADTR